MTPSADCLSGFRVRRSLAFLAWLPLTQLVLAAPVPVPLVNPSFELPVLAQPPGVSFGQLQDQKAFPGNWQSDAPSLGITYGNWGELPGASDGTQFLFASSNKYGEVSQRFAFRIWQAVGPVEADTNYNLQVDLRPGLGAPGKDPAYVLFTADSDNGAVLAGKFYHTDANQATEDFRLVPGQWVTVALKLKGSDFPDLVGRKIRVVIGGQELLVDNVRLTRNLVAPAAGPGSAAPAAEPESAGAGVDWETDLAAAQRRGGRDNKRILVLFANRAADGPRQFEDKVLGNPKVAGVIASRYVAVRLDMSAAEYQKVAGRLGVFRAGVASIYDPRGSFVKRVERPLAPDEMAAELEY